MEEAIRRFAVLRPHLEEDASLVVVARAADIPIRTAQRWLVRYGLEGLGGLESKTRSDRDIRKLPENLVALIEGWRFTNPDHPLPQSVGVLTPLPRVGGGLSHPMAPFIPSCRRSILRWSRWHKMDHVPLETASRLKSSLCLGAISGFLYGKHCSQETETEVNQVNLTVLGEVERENVRLRKEVCLLREKRVVLKKPAGLEPPVRGRNSLCYQLRRRAVNRHPMLDLKQIWCSPTC
ncbi:MULTISPECIES: helix-turn-helix domain-containing protein [Primorskyibacter]|uniref:helix-turn-helix domain-containing protein n=1 Tax=Primorskyibacter TaxID=1068904 RepID=UPI00117A38E4|nr:MULTISPECIES: helix-turn-helix domain-containing protein [Primorskyibacter]